MISLQYFVVYSFLILLSHFKCATKALAAKNAVFPWLISMNLFK